MAVAGVKLTFSSGVTALAAIAGCIAVTQAALGEEPRGLAVDLSDCVELQSAEERFECYERRVEAARRPAEGADQEGGSASRPEAPADEATAREVEPAPAEEPPPAQEVLRAGRPGVDTFGFPERRERSGEERAELRGVVASLRETVPNSYIIELENGQVWRQMRPQRYHLRPGQSVRIYSTNWGTAFRLSADELNGFIQVERVR